MFDDRESVLAAMRAGAHGYLHKTAGQTDIIRAIHAVHHGEAIFSPGVAGAIISYLRRQPSPDTPEFTTLTRREHEILGLVAEGLDNHAIARQLFISEKTVRNHVSNIFVKLEVARRAEAIARPPIRNRHLTKPAGHCRGR